MGYYIYTDEKQVTRILKAMDSLKDSRPVLKEAINNTGKEAQKRIIKKAQETYSYKTRFTNKDLHLKKATLSNLNAHLLASGSGTNLTHFVANGPMAWKQTIPGAPATRAKAIKQNPLKSLHRDRFKHFIARLPGGGKFAVTRTADWSDHRTKLGSRFLRTAVSVSVPGMLGSSERVWKFVSPDLGNILEHNVTVAIAKRLGGNP